LLFAFLIGDILVTVNDPAENKEGDHIKAHSGTPEDLQGPAVFLASDASNFVNGHILYVDGGILAYIGKQPG
jgi:NAD(P)-dependent dehydrogenase (short-subunit alcohol dehydrogenase family)